MTIWLMVTIRFVHLPLNCNTPFGLVAFHRVICDFVETMTVSGAALLATHVGDTRDLCIKSCLADTIVVDWL